MTREEAEKELIAMLEEAEGGPSYSMEEVDAYMRELLHPKNQIYLTGDTHGQFERIISFCERQQPQRFKKSKCMQPLDVNTETGRYFQTVDNEIGQHSPRPQQNFYRGKL